MKVYYTGKSENLTADQQRKIESKFARLARMLDMKQGEREAHVILKAERHVHQAEITVRFHDHNLVGVGAGSDDYLAMHEALEKLEKQVQKLREKSRDLKRSPREEWMQAAEAEPEESEVEVQPGRLLRIVDNHAGRKPLTPEEALLEMDRDRDYLVFQDALTNRLCVLIRRRDGNFDLIRT